MFRFPFLLQKFCDLCSFIEGKSKETRDNFTIYILRWRGKHKHYCRQIFQKKKFKFRLAQDAFEIV